MDASRNNYASYLCYTIEYNIHLSVIWQKPTINASDVLNNAQVKIRN